MFDLVFYEMIKLELLEYSDNRNPLNCRDNIKQYENRIHIISLTLFNNTNILIYLENYIIYFKLVFNKHIDYSMLI